VIGLPDDFKVNVLSRYRQNMAAIVLSHYVVRNCDHSSSD
jgi:hypothetical protein